MKVLLVEKNNVIGGLTSGFYRKDYYFEAGTAGISLPNFFIELLNDLKDGLGDLIVLEKYKISLNDKVINFSEFDAIYKEFSLLYPDKKKALKSFLKQMTKGINLMKKVLIKFNIFRWFKNGVFYKFITLLKALPFVIKNIFYMGKLNKVSSDKIISSIFESIDSNPAYFFSNMSLYRNLNFMTYLGIWNDFINGIGYVKNGFLNLANELRLEFEKNGGETLLNSKVDTVMVKNRKVSGVVIKDEEYFSDYVICNMDMKKFVFDIVGEKHFSKRFTKKLAGATMSESFLIFYFGIRMSSKELKKYIPTQHIVYFSKDFKKEEHYKEYYENCPCIVTPLYYLTDKEKSENISSIIVQVPVSDLCDPKWKDLSQEEYKNLKKEIIDIAKKRLGEIVPGFDSILEVADVATPKSIENWVGSTNGASNGFSWNKKLSFLKSRSFAKMYLKSEIKNLFFCGASASPNGGVFYSGLSGSLVADKIKKRQD